MKSQYSLNWDPPHPTQGELEGVGNCFWHWNKNRMSKKAVESIRYITFFASCSCSYILNYACSIFCSDQLKSESQFLPPSYSPWSLPLVRASAPPARILFLICNAQVIKQRHLLTGSSQCRAIGSGCLISGGGSSIQPHPSSDIAKWNRWYFSSLI